MPRASKRLLSSVLLTGIVACAGGSSRAVPPPAPPGASAAAASSSAAPRGAAPAQVVEVTAADQPRATPNVLRAPVYVIARTSGGRTPDELGRIFAPTQERVQQCVQGPTGVVRITVETKGGRTLFTIEPDTTLTDTARRCILEALSTLDLDNDPSKRLGPEGWTSHVIIQW